MASSGLRQERGVIKTFLERMPLYEPFLIESGASPDNVIEKYIEEVKRSDIIILVLKKELREGVRKEFVAAKDYKKRIFAYLHSQNANKELKDFFRNEVQKIGTTAFFNKTAELIDQIEKDLLDDLVSKYVQFYEENIILREKIKDLNIQKIENKTLKGVLDGGHIQ